MRTVTAAQMHPMSKTAQIKKLGTAKPKPQEVKVAVEQAPAPAINIDMSKFSEDNTAAFKMLADATKAQPAGPTAESPKEREFTVTRDGNNLIQSITAKCK
jgi:hypothetical protein